MLTLISGLGVIGQAAKTARMHITDKILNALINITVSSLYYNMVTQGLLVMQYYTESKKLLINNKITAFKELE